MTYTFSAGLLYWAEIRDFLNSEKFSGRQIEWQEGSTWVQRDFTIKGPPGDVHAVATVIRRWAARIEQEERERERREELERHQRKLRYRKFWKIVLGAAIASGLGYLIWSVL